METDANNAGHEDRWSRLRSYLRTKRNELIIAVIGFVLGTVVIGTALAVVQEGLKRWVFRHFSG